MTDTYLKTIQETIYQFHYSLYSYRTVDQDIVYHLSTISLLLYLKWPVKQAIISKLPKLPDDTVVKELGLKKVSLCQLIIWPVKPTVSGMSNSM